MSRSGGAAVCPGLAGVALDPAVLLFHFWFSRSAMICAMVL